MNTQKMFCSIVAAGLLGFAGSGLGQNLTFTGTWTNETFDTTGSMQIDIVANAKTMTGTVTLGGFVFGNPMGLPALVFSGPVNPDLSSTFSGTSLGGTLSGSIDSAGNLVLTITTIPDGFPEELRFSGAFNFLVGTFAGGYQLDFPANTLLAQGKSEATLVGPPVIIADKRVRFRGSTGKLGLSAFTGSALTKPKVRASGRARVKLAGRNPFRLIVRKPDRRVTNVRLILKNASGTSRQGIRFINRN